ncbi:phage tail sheath family protein [Bradyrhizobium sp. 2S1]|uniref:phage tail sheath family protein n=1 Tax=Bradyrhizobium sp. 2S1 TaxID=1404429 RepID=UPI0014073075|nr:phage tail sheath subtilisin-like domain-containing protein [Bradyrhizobium sp. 2S1]MCK7668285.1 phage tail sheath subtilisin-like domain-containing protein [Bradyrhizobium sp. 2S1]
MPAALTYPGVYIEEVSSGVHTITGVATSITAFIGRALRGPSDEPVTINNYGDFERIFGGLWLDSTLGYAVRDFYLNGGGQAIIVRLYHGKIAAGDEADALAAAKDTAAEGAGAGDAATALAKIKAKADSYADEPKKSAAKAVYDAAAKEVADNSSATAATVEAAAKSAIAKAVPLGKATLNVKGLNLQARYQGVWGNKLRGRVDLDVKDADGNDVQGLFNRTIYDGTTQQTESFRNLSVDAANARRVDKVLKNESRLVEMTGALPVLPTAHAKDPAQGKTIWNDDNASTGVLDTAGDGDALAIADFNGQGKEDKKDGLYALEDAELFNILCIPPYLAGGEVDPALVAEAAVYCERRRAMLLVDPPARWKDKKGAIDGLSNLGTKSKNAALFFPRLKQPNPLNSNLVEQFAPCGAVAGIFARTDTTRGVWKAPAGLEATLVGVPELSVPLTDAENGELNPLGVNCLRTMPAAGRIIWGSRTLQGDDRLASEWKYVPVRRTALFLEESLYRGTQWVVFEPNDEPLWAQIRLNVGAFMQSLFRQGAFQGKTPAEAYFVKCGKDTTTQNDIDLGIVNVLVGFAPLKPAEFVVIKLHQIAGQIQT